MDRSKSSLVRNSDDGQQPATQVDTEASKISKVVSVMRAFAEQTNNLGLDGLRDNYMKLQARGPHPSNLTFNAQLLNRTKCRYHDIMCLDQSRVILRPWQNDTSDFIHANWIHNELLENTFICTQGPLNDTCADFWRMVWQENVELIIMLCRTCEENRSKCAQYWPSNPSQVITFCGITIRTVEKKIDDPDVHCTAILMTYRGERRTLAHYQWVSWPDKFVPNQLTVPFTLLSSARARKTPTIIHCSAGIGRTGTLVVTLLSGRIPIVPEIIWSIRSQRSRAVQNEEQYLYIHYLTVQRLINKGIVSDKVISKFCREYEHFYFTRTNRTQIPLPVHVGVKEAQTKGTSALEAASKIQDMNITVPNDSRKVQTPKKGKGTKKKKQQAVEVTEERVPSGETLTAEPAKPSRSVVDLQQQYQEAQYALLESYRKAQMALLKTYEKKKRLGFQLKTGQITSQGSTKQKAQKEAQAAIAEVAGINIKKSIHLYYIQQTKTEGGDERVPSVYAFLTDEVWKFKRMEERQAQKDDDEINRADYVFMQPIYASIYGPTPRKNVQHDVVEKYVMNMLPEQYFDRSEIEPVRTTKGRPKASKRRTSKSPQKTKDK
ncbi:unnamed protein product [Thelazia callipaeda]|uniref:Protein-tyrosine phosphatase n=1 Tax=Thelazia callipaeda TaxID=103827 RepID=A0A158RBE5_THECL|nr:unnamed protein product [Thelazia callipaeda]